MDYSRFFGPIDSHGADTVAPFPVSQDEESNEASHQTRVVPACPCECLPLGIFFCGGGMSAAGEGGGVVGHRRAMDRRGIGDRLERHGRWDRRGMCDG